MSSSFQQDVYGAVQGQLRRLGIPYTTNVVDAADDSYAVVKASGLSKRVEIYVYLHEAGFFLADEWQIFERCDYDDEQTLKYTFLDSLYRALSDAQHG